jgi:hypothetical protein
MMADHDYAEIAAMLRAWANCPPYLTPPKSPVEYGYLNIADAITALLAERDALREAAKTALGEMCRTKAPRNSFTDAVDALDAALNQGGGNG